MAPRAHHNTLRSRTVLADPLVCNTLLPLFTSTVLSLPVTQPLFSGFLLVISLLPHSCSLFSLLPTLSPVVYFDNTNMMSVVKADPKGRQMAIFSLLHTHTISHRTLDKSDCSVMRDPYELLICDVGM